nr:probable anion transporter 4, chloroplastic [Leptinotarsa decemlineata]
MGRIRWTRTSRIVALCSFANFINSADRVIMPIAIVPMTDIFNWTLHSQGWILSAFAFGYFTSQILGSFWATKLGAKNVLICSVLLWSIATFITPLLAASITSLVICRIVLGFAEGLAPQRFHPLSECISDGLPLLQINLRIDMMAESVVREEASSK